MLRAAPFVLLALLVFGACLRDQAIAGTPAAAPAVQAAASAGSARPVPADLPEVLARVNGEVIGKAEFERQLQSLEARAGGPVPPDQRDRVYRGLLDQMIGYRLLIQETQARKVTVPDADVEARISQIRTQFPSEQVFEQALAEQQLTLDQLRSEARADIAVTRMLREEVAAKAAVTPEQVDAFYRDNPDEFRQGEQVRASHILIAVAADSDAATRATARAKAEQVLAEVKAGGDFPALARAHSQDPGSAADGGDLGVFERGQMVGPFEEAAFTLAEGQTSGLVETRFGFHIIRVTSKRPARLIPLDEVRGQVEQYLSERNQQEQAEAFVSVLRMKGRIEVFI